MDEHAARRVVLVRAVESSDAARALLSDADRVWAGRTAAEIVGEQAPDHVFLDRRSALVIDRLAKRYAKVAALARGRSHAWWIPLVMLVALIAGVAGVDIGPAHRINLLAPPVLALLAWNIGVYGALAAAALLRRPAERGPVRTRVAALLRDLPRPERRSRAPAPLAGAFARFIGDWSALAAPLWRDRAAKLLHLGAAALAAGAIAGLYLRGIALEYRASWQSTFLDADDVARVLRAVLAPGAWLTGIPIADATHLQAIGAQSAGENAAPWIHLYAATILLVVIAPRAALAWLAAVRERRRANAFPVDVGEPYFQRLLRAWREGTARVVALPYSYDVGAANAHGLAAVATRAFESNVDIAWAPAVAYGADEIPPIAATPASAVVALFSLSATPEQETHGAFVDALVTSVTDHAAVIAVIDTSDFVERFGADSRRVAEREAAWQRMLAERHVDPLFVRLADPDIAGAASALTKRLEAVAT